VQYTSGPKIWGGIGLTACRVRSRIDIVLHDCVNCTNCMKSMKCVMQMNPRMMDVFGTVKVGERGQIVVPSTARKSLGINPGDYLLVVSTPSKDGLALIKVEIVREMIEKMSSGLTGHKERTGRRSKRKAEK